MSTITRKAIIFTGKQAMEIREEQIPHPDKDNVLIEVTRSLISTGTEMTIFMRNFAPDTHWDNWIKYPFYPGYLVAGIVTEVGPEVKDIKVGDRVASRQSHASHVIKAERDVLKIPEGVTEDDAVWAGLGKIVQVGVRTAAHVLGDTVVIIGLGLLGQLVVQYVKLMGAGEIIAVDMSEKRLAMAKAHGATATIQSGVAEAKAEILKITGGRGADVVYDVTGFPPVFTIALQLARKSGTIVVLGDAGSPGEQRLGPEIITKGLRIVGSHDDIPPHYVTDGVRWSGRQIYELFLTYLARKQIVLKDLITHRFKPGDAAKAYELLQKDRMNVMAVMLDWK